ncbi:alkaline phosphatase D family protein [Nocardioides solisilvae]|uniref:alkaline phosphatase D family protein n=1 Tax=Nocardioides solisilvae TaxID=1542435 RepID=UPI000D74C691|nr:alkaline phosphatase D family protein [Nocardioides solisilvae]
MPGQALATLPTVLCGPVLRRTEAEQVHVWLATSEPLQQPELHLHAVVAGRGGPTLGPRLGGGQAVGGAPAARSLQLGDRLWVHLLRGTAGTSTPLPTDTLLAYDVIEAGGRQRRLRDLLDLSTVVLAGLPLPTFVVQGTRTPAHVLYGSCRKLHGPGTDNAPVLERLLERYARDPRHRPQTLLLGGDQVYADDVSDVLVGHLNALGAQVLGRVERLPGVADASRIPVHGRQRLVEGVGHLTSGEAANHLLTLGEWVAAYLLSWNPDTWPARLPTMGETWGRVDHRQRPPVAEWATAYEEQLRSVRDSRTGSASMRRVLANVATYMVFDDHEVTDDWNLNPRWVQHARRSALGRTVLLHGLASYWAFQAWGNDPAQFRDPFGTAVADYMRTGNGGDRALRVLDDHPDWGFVAPTVPRTVVLDTRTRRAPTTGYDVVDGVPMPRATTAPRLLDAGGRSVVRQRLTAARKVDRAAIVLAPSPVWGLEDIESVLQPLGYVAPAAVDFESWSANPRSRLDLMTIAQDLGVRPLVVLSGDVHYGLSVAARATVRGTDHHYAQFCSSAMKNQAGGKLAWALRIAGFELPAPDTRTHVWIGGGADGPTSRLTVDPLQLATDPVYALQTEGLLALNRALLGAEAWTERRAYHEMASHLAGLVGSVEVARNNVGQLWMRGDVVNHQHWQLERTTLRAVGRLSWSTSSWPV